MEILILQHPKEKADPLSSLPTLKKLHPEVQIKVGLSWKSLSHALGKDANPKDWVVFYLGTGTKLSPIEKKETLLFIHNKTKTPVSSPFKTPPKGIVFLDGTWPQVKALWWRNPWLLKLSRAILSSTPKPLYGRLRRNPKQNGLSTLEAVVYATRDLNKEPNLHETTLAGFKDFLETFTPKPPSQNSTPLPG